MRVRQNTRSCVGQQHLTPDPAWRPVHLGDAISEQDRDFFFFFSPCRAKQTGGQTARRKSLCSNTPTLHKQAARFLGTHLRSPGMFYWGLTPRASRKQPEVVYVPNTLKTGGGATKGAWQLQAAPGQHPERGVEAVQSSLCK